MTSSQAVELVLALALIASLCWLVFVTIPGYLSSVVSDRLRETREELREFAAGKPHISKHDEVRSIDYFLHAALAHDYHFGLSTALAVLTGVAMTPREVIEAERHRQDDLVEGLDEREQDQLATIAVRALRLSFCRAFLGSCVWFIAWPAAAWAVRHFRVRGPMDQDQWATAALIIPIESARELLVKTDQGGGPVGFGPRHRTAS